MNLRKRVFAAVIALVICLCAVIADVPQGIVQVPAEETEDGFMYSIGEDNTVTITGYNGSESELSIPDVIDGYTVTGIDSYAIFGTKLLTSVEIPSSVISIGTYAFKSCRNLLKIEVHQSNPVYTSENGVLFNKEKTDLITCPGGLQGKYEIPSGVIRISERAFYGCSGLTDIEIPSSVTNIGNYVFSGCSGLIQIKLPTGVTVIGDFTFEGCSSLTRIEIPSSVTSIENGAFEGCSSLTQIEIPSSVTSIGGYAFSGCSSLTRIEISSNVTSIGVYAFWYCSSLLRIEVDQSNPEYTSEDGVLFNKEKTILIACPGGKQDEYKIPASVTSIDNYAFYKCSSLTQIEIPASVTSIDYYAFHGCSSLLRIEVDQSNSEFTSENGVLFNKEKTILIACPGGKQDEYKVPASVTGIGDCAFYECSNLTQIEIPASVTSIGNGAFVGCSSLTQIEIPSSVTSIGYEAFELCFSLTIWCYPDSVAAEYAMIYDIPYLYIASSSSFDINVTDDGLAEISRFNGEESDFVIPSEIEGHKVVSIGTGAFKDSNVKNIVVPNSVTSIGNSAFYGCSSLTQIEIPTSVTSIGDDAFHNCSSLSQIEIPSSVTSIGRAAFSGCSNLTIWCDPDSAAEKYAIENNIPYLYFESSTPEPSTSPNPTETTSPSSFEANVSEDGTAEINGHTGEATDIVIPSEIDGHKVTSIGTSAFKNSKLISVVIPDSVTSIGSEAFAGSASLTSVTIPASVTEIAEDAFVGCEQLVIKCYSASAVHYYAQAHGIEFELLDEKNPDVLYGDMDGDGIVDANDALLILKIAAQLETASDGQRLAGDVDENGTLDANDALFVLKKAAQLIDIFPIEE